MGRKLTIIILAVLVLIIGGVAILYLSLNRVIRSAVETYGPQATKSEVKLGSVNVSPFSGNASLSNLVVGNPQGFKTPSAYKLGGMRVALEDWVAGEEGGADLLGFDFLATLSFQAEDVLVVGDGLVEGLDGDAEVVDFGDHRDGRGCVLAG